MTRPSKFRKHSSSNSPAMLIGGLDKSSCASAAATCPLQKTPTKASFSHTPLQFSLSPTSSSLESSGHGRSHNSLDDSTSRLMRLLNSVSRANSSQQSDANSPTIFANNQQCSEANTKTCVNQETLVSLEFNFKYFKFVLINILVFCLFSG